MVEGAVYGYYSLDLKEALTKKICSRRGENTSYFVQWGSWTYRLTQSRWKHPVVAVVGDAARASVHCPTVAGTDADVATIQYPMDVMIYQTPGLTSLPRANELIVTIRTEHAVTEFEIRRNCQ